MKMKNILLSTALVLALGLAGCKKNEVVSSGNESSAASESSETPSSSEVEPVSLIRVEKLASIVVGQTINLDDYVTVEGGAGPKVFTATVAAASADFAVVDGHNLTALAEGNINVTISAGGQSAKFSTVSMSQLKANFGALTADVSNTWAMLELYEDNLYLNTVHRPDYSCFAIWDDDLEVPGGFLKCQNGKTYSYLLDENFANIDVDPEVYSDFENYYCNFDFVLSASDFKTVETDKGEALKMSKTARGAWGSSYFTYKVEEFAYTLALSLGSGYSFDDLYVYPFTLGTGEDAVDTFLFELTILKSLNSSVVATINLVLDLDEEQTEVEAVRNYIDEGNAPEALSFDEAPDAIAAIVRARAYTVELEAGWYNRTTGEPVATPTQYGWEDSMPVGEETDYVNATTTYQAYVVDEETTAVFGSIVKDGQLYSFTNVSGQSVTDTLTATEKTGSSVWTDTIDTLNTVNDEEHWSTFEATSRGTEDGVLYIGGSSDTCVSLIEDLCFTSYLGYIVYVNCFTGLSIEGTSILELGYIDITFGVTDTALLIETSFAYDSTTVYTFSMYVRDIGVDNVPDVSGIVYPA